MPALLHWLFASHAHDLALAKRLADPRIAIPVIASQLFWLVAGWCWLARRTGWGLRIAIAVAVALWYAASFTRVFTLQPYEHSPVRLTPPEVLLVAPFQVWLFGSTATFLLIVLFWLAKMAARVVRRRPRAAAVPADAGRRRFLRHAAQAAVAAPFAVGAYGVLRGRVEVETTHPRIYLPRLPAGFHGLRIAQLSDIHIGPFMSERQVRDVAQTINALRPDLIVLTGDFVTWDASTQTAAVAALAGLRAPFGIYGCLGNHELYTHTEASITRLFQKAGVGILRQAAAIIRVPGIGGDNAAAEMQLLGVDFVPRMNMPHAEYVQASVPQVADLILPGMVNILLAHTPNCFYRAAQLGVDLTISGHTHGGQICCLTPELSPGRFVSPYVAGYFRQGASQLYVNRGLGTIGLPMRICAPPEITLYELSARQA